MKNNSLVTLKDIEITDLQAKEFVPAGHTPSGTKSSGIKYKYNITGPKCLNGQISYIEWDNGEKHVQVSEIYGPSYVMSLNRGRMRLTIKPLSYYGITDNKHEIIVLRQAKIKELTNNHWSSLCKLDPEALTSVCGNDIENVFSSLGAIDVGSKKMLLGDKGKCKNQLCVLIPRSDKRIPVWAFAISRILPLVNEL